MALAVLCVKPALDRLVFWYELGAFAADEIRPETLVLAPGALLWIDGNYAGGACGWDCPLDELPFVTQIEAPNVFNPELDPGNPAILDLWQFLEAPDRTRPFGFRYAFISLGAFEYADAVGIPRTRQETWPDYPMGALVLVEVPESGLLDLRHAKTHFRRFTAQRDVGSYLMFGGLIDKTTNRPDVQDMVRDLVRVSRAE
ncbi:MAG TPA: hypothetical protein PLI13_01275 [Paracoccus sp. (in: a-proteobacteria)]|nr:hypothetical protein [Paracoccus sp. (in: a-proteobacteria)]HRM73328.1 hypothetical protein [Paracoccus sp. (in: a-proteobacteria)]